MIGREESAKEPCTHNGGATNLMADKEICLIPLVLRAKK